MDFAYSLCLFELVPQPEESLTYLTKYGITLSLLNLVIFSSAWISLLDENLSMESSDRGGRTKYVLGVIERWSNVSNFPTHLEVRI